VRRPFGTRAARVLVLLVAAAPAVATEAAAQDGSYSEWLNRRLREIVAARIGQTSNTNQAETPSLGGNSSAVADQSSASDLVGIGINPLEIPKESDEIERVTHAITINPYLVYAGLFSPDDPLRPNVYRERVAEVLRKFSVTVGFEELRSSDQAAADRRGTILGLKFLSWNRRATSAAEQDDLIVRLRAASFAFAELDETVKDSLFEWAGGQLGYGEDRTEIIRFRNDLDTNLTRILDLIGEPRRRQLDRIIERAILPFEELETVANDLAATLRRRLQVSLAFYSKAGRQLADEYRGSAILDFGPERMLNLTLNGSFEFLEAVTAGEDDHYGASVAGQATFRLTGENIFGTQPATFSVAGRWRKLSRMDAVFAVQAKLTLPIANGLSLPVSFTVASDPDDIDEEEVRGQIGFTIDTARLFAGLVR